MICCIYRVSESFNEISLPDGVSDRLNELLERAKLSLSKPKVSYTDLISLLTKLKCSSSSELSSNSDKPNKQSPFALSQPLVIDIFADTASELNETIGAIPSHILNKLLPEEAYLLSPEAITHIFQQLSLQPGRYTDMTDLIDTLNILKITPPLEVYNTLITYCTHTLRDPQIAESYFTQLTSVGHTPNTASWAGLITAKIRTTGTIDTGLQVLTRLDKLGVPIDITIYNNILKEYVKLRHNYDIVKKFWMNIHCIPDLTLNLDTFNIYLKHLKLTGRVERALFIMDEMKALDITPDATTFEQVYSYCYCNICAIYYAHIHRI